MAELLASAIVETLVGTLTSAAMREIGRLWGLGDELDALQSMLTTLQSSMKDTEMQQRKIESQKDWFRKLKDAAYDVEAVLDMMQYEALRRRADSQRGKLFPSLRSSLRLQFRSEMANRVKNVRKKLAAIADERRIFPTMEGVVENRFGVMIESRQTGSLVTESEICGRQEEKETIVMKMLDIASNRDGLSVLAICGMGGLGKTTLAQLVYNDQRIEKQFDLRMWVCVSDDFDVQRLVRRIFECVDGGPCSISEFDLLQRHLRGSLMGKKFLLVLDDVWNENHRLWDGLRQTLSCNSKGSVLLLTTRNQKVATMMAASYVHEIGSLSEEHSWSLFKQRASLTGEVHENLVPIGKMIVKKCQGVPLSIKSIGSMMQSATSESEWWAVEESELWNLLDDDNGLTPALTLSYNNLKPHLRQCFAYCCIFPKDYEMEVVRLIQLWMANGFIPSGDQKDLLYFGQSIFKELACKSFFQEIKKNNKGNMTCKMHDLMHDLASFVMGDETYVLEFNSNKKVPKRSCHLSFACWDVGDILKEYSKFTVPTDDSLRSFLMLEIWSYHHDKEEDLISFLSKQQFLRALELPFKVNLSKLFKLKHLRHLVVSCDGIKRLPNSLTSLYNLQTLKLMYSHSLLKLPKDLKVMRNLWHWKWMTLIHFCVPLVGWEN